MKAEDFIGLSKKESQDLCERKNFLYRLIKIDDKQFFSYPSDVRNDRVCVELEKGKVVVAKFM